MFFTHGKKMKKIKYYSQIGQDKIVIDLLKQKTNGTFLDIGCSDPVRISNTMCMESQFGWKGLAIDIDCALGELWKSRKKSKFICANAISIDWVKLLKEYDMPNKIDFLSLDLEPPDVTLSVLKNIPLDKISFNVITFEHDDYRKYGTKIPSRKYLSDAGYILHKELFGKLEDGSPASQDDIWVHNSIS
jgi:hypothetical protein